MNRADFERSLTDPKVLSSEEISVGVICQAVHRNLRTLTEFRSRSLSGSRSSAEESWEGSQIPSVLFNLRVHSSATKRDRYDSIRQKFEEMFPRFTFQAVSRESGTMDVDIQLFERGNNSPLPYELLSAGTHQLLTMITNLIGQDDLIVVLEEPELNLHPQAIEACRRMISDSSNRNQVIVITHSPQLADPDEIQGLRRVTWNPVEGTVVTQAPKLTEKQLGQVRTALRNRDKREMLFARSVLLVEDESLREFIRRAGPKLKVDGSALDPDVLGIAVVDFGGESGHPAYRELLDLLAIPFVVLKDKVWGDPIHYPPEIYFELDGEFEEFMDKNGHGDLRQELKEELGVADDTSGHRRIAAALGDRLEADQVPELFVRVLTAAADLAKRGTPAS